MASVHHNDSNVQLGQLPTSSGNNVTLAQSFSSGSVTPFTQYASLTMLAEAGRPTAASRNSKQPPAAAGAARPGRQSGITTSGATLEAIRNMVQQRDGNALKTVLRSLTWPATHSSRRALCNELVTMLVADESAVYREAVTKLSSAAPPLPSFTSAAHTHAFCLRSAGVFAVHRLLAVLHLHHPHVIYCPMLYPLAAVLLHYVSEESTYSMLCSLLSNQPSQLLKRAKKSKSDDSAKHRLDWIIQTQQAYEVATLTLRSLVKKYSPVAFAYFKSVLGEKDVFVYYEDWLWWVIEQLPLDHLVRVLDCYFIEGIKVFYRVAIVLVKSFHLHSKDQASYNSSAELCAAMRQHCRAGAALPPDELLSLAFKLRGFSKTQLLRYYSRFEDSIGEYRALRLARNDPQRPSGGNAAAGADAADNSASVVAPLSIESIDAFRSSMISNDHLRTIWSWLPDRIQLQRPFVIFSTNDHGYNLNTLYSRSDQYEPTIILVRSARGAVFGAYCSAPWAEREARTSGGSHRHAAPAFFGTGESFVFTMAPVARAFKWVGMSMKHASTDSARQGSKPEKEKDLPHVFQLGLRDALAIGGCGRDAALFLDESLTKGSSRRCATFNNECLAEAEDFDCMCIEVIAFERT